MIKSKYIVIRSPLITATDSCRNELVIVTVVGGSRYIPTNIFFNNKLEAIASAKLMNSMHGSSYKYQVLATREIPL